MNKTTRQSLGVALVCVVLLVVAVIVNQLHGADPLLDLFVGLAVVVGLGALLVAGVSLVRQS